MVKVPKCWDTQISRCIAFVKFYRHEDADRALNELNGYLYDNRVLNVEWAKPAKKSDYDSSRFRSGYGERLAQDTKEKCSFASNLTL